MADQTLQGHRARWRLAACVALLGTTAAVRGAQTPAVPVFDEPRAQWFAAPPLACLDELQPRPVVRPYFWDATFKPVDGYDKTRAFYGCGDWHSAVNATWTLVTVLKRFPDLSVGRLIREKLNDHLGKSNLDGEVAFFKDAGTFERPYGYVSLLALEAELATWDDPQAAQWAANSAPLAKYFSEQLIAYLKDLDRPVRTGGSNNTALVLLMAIDSSETLRDYTLRAAAIDYARKAYAKDTDCATDAEPAAGDLVSPCLTEADLMSRALDRPSFVAWLDGFLPAVTSPKFSALLTGATAPAGPPGRRGGADAAATGAGEGAPARTGGAGAAPTSAAAGRPAGAGRGGASRAAPIALAFTRGAAFAGIAAALPATDARAAVFERLSAVHADAAARALADPAALGAPWLGAYAIRALARER